MIEQINGTGLSGITGKSGKQGKSSLFAKLFAMLEKHAEVSGKGKDAALNGIGHGKGKPIIAASDKGDPLLAAKGKQLLAMAAKDKTGSNKLAEETATPLITNVIIDQQAQTKAAERTGKVNVLIAEQHGTDKGEQANAALKQPAKGETKTAPGTFSLHAGTDADEAEQPTQSVNKPVAATTDNKPLAANAATTDNKPLAATKPLVSETKTAATATAENHAQPLLTAAKAEAVTSAKAGIDKPAAAGQSSVQTTATAPERQVLRSDTEQYVAATTPASKPRADKVDIQGKAEASQAAAIQPQHGKTPQTQAAQNSNSNSTVTASAVAQSGSFDASTADSQSGSSDKGNQEGRSMSALSGDAKSNSSTAASNANFQSYLTGKSAPSMSVFESMNHIAQSAGKGQNKLEIQLEPLNLGKIQIILQTDAAKQLHVHMVVDQGTTRAALELQLPVLKAALSQQGFDLSGFSMDSNGQQQAFNEEGNGRRGHADMPELSAITIESTVTAMQQQPGRSADGSLSIRV